MVVQESVRAAGIIVISRDHATIVDARSSGEGATDGSGLGRTPTGVGVAAVGTDELPPLPPPHALSSTTPAQSQLSRRNDERQRFIGYTSIASDLSIGTDPVMRMGCSRRLSLCSASYDSGLFARFRKSSKAVGRPGLVCVAT